MSRALQTSAPPLSAPLLEMEAPRHGGTWAERALPGLRQWRQGLTREGAVLSLATLGAAAGAVLLPWTTWDSFVAGALCFRAVLGLYAGNALVGVRAHAARLALLPERELPRVAGVGRALLPVGLLVVMVAWLASARLATRVFPEEATLEPTPQGATYRNESNAMSIHLPVSWTVNNAQQWPTLLTASNANGSCQARVLLTYAPPLPDALDGFYVERMMAHHLGVHTVEASDRMFVSMWPTRQFQVEQAAGASVLTAVQRDNTWVVMQLSSSGDLGSCALDFSRIRSSWMLW
jgi:hypothetical protein